MSYGLVCLTCRLYIRNALQPDVSQPCVCDVPRPSWDGVTEVQGTSPFADALHGAFDRALRGEYDPPRRGTAWLSRRRGLRN